MAPSPRRRTRPLPPIPFSTPLQDNPPPEKPPQHHVSSLRRRGSIITTASVAESAHTTQTVLPSYSTIDLPLVNNARSEGRGPGLATYDSWTGSLAMLDLPPDLNPPRYSILVPPDTPTTPLPSIPVDQSRREREVPGNLDPRSRGHPGFTQHHLYLKKSGATKPWATLRLIGRQPLPKSNTQTPRFISGDDVKGVLKLELDKPTSVQNITIILRGSVTTCHLGRSTHETRDFVFLEHPHVVYSKMVTGDPRGFGQCEVSKSRRFDGKMQGGYRFPFLFQFPTAAIWGDGQAGIPTLNYELPPTFQERDSGGTVRYSLELTIDHGRLKLSSSVKTNIVCVPRIIAPPASQKRQHAYLEGRPLPSPRSDPGGWRSASSVSLAGVFQGRNTEISCTLYLAEPLCYTRGTVLPCYVALSSPDFLLLDYLASPKMMDVRLSRRVTYFGDGNLFPKMGHQKIGREEEITCSGIATWWNPPKSEEPEALETRWLEGEIHLTKDLQPSCNFLPFTIQYTIELMPFPPEIFAINDRRWQSQQRPIISQVVRIATFHQYGPVPTPFSSKGIGQASDLEKAQTMSSGAGFLLRFSIHGGDHVCTPIR